MVSTAVDIVDETATSAKKKIKGEKESPETLRAIIDAMEIATLKRLFAESPEAGELFDESPAYAMFDSRNMSLLITTSFGSRATVDKETGKRVYMKMAEAGVNCGEAHSSTGSGSLFLRLRVTMLSSTRDGMPEPVRMQRQEKTMRISCCGFRMAPGFTSSTKRELSSGIH